MKHRTALQFRPLQVIPVAAAAGAAQKPATADATSRWLPFARVAALAGIGSTAGAIAINVDLPSAGYAWSVTQGFLFAAALLVIGLRVARRRREVFSLLAGWYFGALAAIPGTWSAFFGSSMGWPVWAVLSLLLAAPSFLAPKRTPALGMISVLVLGVVPPLGFVGMVSPLLAAGALFGGAGWLGLCLWIGVLALCSVPRRGAVVVQMLALAWGLVTLQRPAPAAPDDVWAAVTRTGAYPEGSLRRSFARQDAAKRTVQGAITEGARFVVMPETTNPLWDDGQAFYWGEVRAKAAAAHAQVLLGVYTNPMQSPARTDGIVDLSSGLLYPARVAMPIAMWRPWSEDSFPLHMDATGAIPTAHGPAAYLVCYEELLVWPLALQMLHERPALLITVANQWFAHDWLKRPQERSVAMQARLWGLPLVRAVNQPQQ